MVGSTIPSPSFAWPWSLHTHYQLREMLIFLMFRAMRIVRIHRSLKRNVAYM